MASDAPSSHPDKACPVPSFAEKPIWDPEKVSNDAIEQFRGVLMSKYPSHKEIFASTKIETYSTKDIAFPPAFWPFIFIMNSFDGRNSELYFDREGNLLFDTKKDFESDWAILRKLPWTAYFKKSGEDYDFIIESMEDPTKKCIFPKNSSQYREAIIDMFIRFVVLDKYDDWH